MENKKHYNLSTTEDNGQSITTTNTSTEHPAEILRMMQLAGMETAHMAHQHEESIEEEVDSEFKPTPANDKLDLDDYSKKSPESINKQQKSIQPTLGDNPLEYSIDENEIYEGLMKEFDASEELAEERVDEILPIIGAVAGAVARKVGGAILRNPIKSMAAASLLTKKEEPAPVNASKKKKGEKLNAYKEGTEELNEVGRTIEKEKERLASLEKHQVKMKDDKMEVARLQDLIDQAKKNIANNMNESEELEEAQSPAQKAAFAKMLAAKNPKKEEAVEETEETSEEKVEENLEKAQEQINELKEDCSCGHDSDCDCGPECDCGCNAVKESTEELSMQDAVNESQARLRKLMNY